MTTYAEYLKKGNKVNPTLLAPKEAKPPTSVRAKKPKTQTPPLDATNKNRFKGTVITFRGFKG